MSTSPETIFNLRVHSKNVDAQRWRLERWPNGAYFIEAPSGEGTEVPEEAVAGALAQLFTTFF